MVQFLFATNKALETHTKIYHHLILPKSIKKDPPIIGSGIVIKTAPNFCSTPNTIKKPTQ